MSTIIKPSPALTNKPSGKLYLSANQLDIPHGAWTLVELDTISGRFTDGIEDTVNHRITPGVAGFYDIKANIRYTSVVANHRYYAGIRLNSLAFLHKGLSHSAIAQDLSIPCFCDFYLSATDYIDLWAYQYSGVNTVDIVADETLLTAQRTR